MSINNIKQELVVFLRNSDVLSTGTRGVTTSQDTGTFSSAGTHTLATNPTQARNVRDITVGGTPLVLGTDYSVAYSTGVITFVANQTGAYTINYDQGTTDKIYPDFPRDDLTISSYPRIAIDIMSSNTESFGIGGASFITSYSLTVVAYSDSVTLIDDYMQTIRTSFINSAKSFFNISFVTPTNLGPLIISPDKSTEIMQRNQDFQIMFEVQTAV